MQEIKVLFLIAIIWGAVYWITGCSTTQYVPTQQPKTVYPAISPCPDLQLATKDTFVQTILENYSQYKQCKAQVDTMIEFIHKQEN